MRTTGLVYGSTQALLAKEFDLTRKHSLRPTGSSGPYEPTEAMLANELRLRTCPTPSILEPDTQYELSAYQPSRGMLAKEVHEGSQLPPA